MKEPQSALEAKPPGTVNLVRVVKRNYYPDSRRSRQHRVVAHDCAGRVRKIDLRRQNDLINRQPVFTHLNSQRVRAAVCEVDQWPQLTDAPAVVLPAPATQSSREPVFEIDRLRAGRADPAPCRALLIDAVVELHEN